MFAINVVDNITFEIWSRTISAVSPTPYREYAVNPKRRKTKIISFFVSLRRTIYTYNDTRQCKTVRRTPRKVFSRRISGARKSFVSELAKIIIRRNTLCPYNIIRVYIYIYICSFEFSRVTAVAILTAAARTVGTLPKHAGNPIRRRPRAAGRGEHFFPSVAPATAVKSCALRPIKIVFRPEAKSVSDLKFPIDEPISRVVYHAIGTCAAAVLCVNF